MNKRPTCWEECAREDLNMIPKMIAAGWKPRLSHNDKFHGRDAENFDLTTIPHDEVSFEKPPYVVRQGYDRKPFEEGGLQQYWIILHTKRLETLQEVLDKGDNL